MERKWNIVVHPDVIYTPQRWECFGEHLLIENMDRRKLVGRTVGELTRFFDYLPKARLCLDVAHARQIDSSLALLTGLIRAFMDRIAEIHISELDSRCRHVPMTNTAVFDYRRFASRIGAHVPVIIESMLDRKMEAARLEEVELARQALAPDQKEHSYWGEYKTPHYGYESLNFGTPHDEKTVPLYHTVT